MGSTGGSCVAPHPLPAIDKAAEAELDPKRGPENARQILERAKADAANPAEEMTFQLRVAELELRRTFLTESELDRWLPMMVLGPHSGGAVPGLPLPGGHEGHGH